MCFCRFFSDPSTIKSGLLVSRKCNLNSISSNEITGNGWIVFTMTSKFLIQDPIIIWTSNVDFVYLSPLKLCTKIKGVPLGICMKLTLANDLTQDHTGYYNTLYFKVFATTDPKYFNAVTNRTATPCRFGTNCILVFDIMYSDSKCQTNVSYTGSTLYPTDCTSNPRTAHAYSVDLPTNNNNAVAITARMQQFTSTQAITFRLVLCSLTFSYPFIYLNFIFEWSANWIFWTVRLVMQAVPQVHLEAIFPPLFRSQP